MNKTYVEILDRSLNKICEVRALVPLTADGMVLRYSRELSDYGFCEFRISTADPLWDDFGDIAVPHKYHVRIKRGGSYVWQGAIIDNPSRNKGFVQVRAAEYEYYLDKVLIKRTSAVSYGGTEPSEDIGKHYRIFSTGTMATAVTNIITEAVAAFGDNHILGSLTTGTIENPDYPANFTTIAGAALTGAWNFSENVVLQFDYHSVLYVLKAFGVYTNADFQITDDLEFNFEKFLGNKQPGIGFVYGTRGNIVDYDLPRFGGRVVNDLIGIAVTPDGTILHAEKTDEVSKEEFGMLQGPASFTDVKDKNALTARLSAELRLTNSPEVSPSNFVLDEKAYPIGQYDIGDLVTAQVQDGAIDYNEVRRVVGYTVNVHDTGRELTTVQTNKPRPEDVGSEL